MVALEVDRRRESISKWRRIEKETAGGESKGRSDWFCDESMRVVVESEWMSVCLGNKNG